MRIGSGAYYVRPVSSYSRETERRAGGRSGGDPAAPQAGASAGTGATGAEGVESVVAISRLKAVEQEVVKHEAAHKAAGGELAGSVTYTYTVGPDGRRYITGGEVSISMPTGSTPEETVRNMSRVVAAALAPAEPSVQDRAVAARATAIEQKARAEASAERAEEATEPEVVEEPDAAAPSAAAARSTDTSHDRQAPSMVRKGRVSLIAREGDNTSLLRAYYSTARFIPTLSVYA